MREFLAEYVAHAADLMPFYGRQPEELVQTPPPSEKWDEALADAVRGYQQDLGAPKTIRGDEPLVVTGQQPGIFTGPLYTVYKAVTAIKVAGELSERLGRTCLPMFWLGSDDHDFEEARATYFLTKVHRPLEIRYEPEADVSGLPMYRVPLEQSLSDAIDRVAAEVPGSECSGEVRDLLHDTLSASGSIAEWTARLLAHLFRSSPLIFFSPHLPRARRLAADVLAQEISHPLESTRLINETANRLERLGFPSQLHRSESDCNFFLEINGRRRKVVYQRDRFEIPEEDTYMEEDTLSRDLQEQPERFSPNVALRCVVQQHLFPVSAYVAGPGELAYWAQLKPIFEFFEEPMPVVLPRARCVLTTTKLNKLRDNLRVSVADLYEPEDDLLQDILRRTAKNPAFEFTQEKRRRLMSAMDQLVAGLGEHDATAAQVAEGLAKNISAGLDRIEHVILNGQTSQSEAARRQLERLCTSLAPFRKPQERVYNVFSFLFGNGWGLIPRLLDEVDPHASHLQEIEL